MWIIIYVFAFVIAFLGSVVFKLTYESSWAKNYKVKWSEEIGAAGINYSLRNEKNPTDSVYTQYMEIKNSIPKVIEKARELGYNIDKMAMSGGSAGHGLQNDSKMMKLYYEKIEEYLSKYMPIGEK